MLAPDPQDDSAVVISVVYDGPPRAGKTTSVRALARGFGREVHTPEERDGRTVYYDWVEHVGGRFDGQPIRCQIVSVPGQRHWTRRRAHFLDRADVVVFVGDTTAAAWPETVARLAELRANLDARTGTPVGLVFQANKRDFADAVPLAEVMKTAATARTAVVESVAEDGTGVREAFVFAVRLALDRVREELAHDSGHRPSFGEHGPALVEQLRGFDDPLALVEEAEPPPVARPADAGIYGPSHAVPSGFVWPPIEGRILLRQAVPERASPTTKTPLGYWVTASLGEWWVHSSEADEFAQLDDARAALLAWAREHSLAKSVITPRRCIVLAESQPGRWRLWQIVERLPTLRDLLLDNDISEIAANRLVTEVAAACVSHGVQLPCTLETVGVADVTEPVFVGLMPR